MQAGPFAKRSEADRHERAGVGQVVVDADVCIYFIEVSGVSIGWSQVSGSFGSTIATKNFLEVGDLEVYKKLCSCTFVELYGENIRGQSAGKGSLLAGSRRDIGFTYKQKFAIQGLANSPGILILMR
jgi:hypothetical protein